MSETTKKTTGNQSTETVITDPNQVEFDEMQPVFSTKKPDELLPFRSRPDNIIAEGEKLSVQVRVDYKELIGVGLPELTTRHIRKMPGACRNVQSKWKTLATAKQQWDAESAEAFHVLELIIRAALFICQDNPPLLATVRSILKGRSKRKKVQQLSDMHTFCREHSDELKDINFEFALLDRAAVLSAKLGDLLGSIEAEENSIRLLRRQAFSYLSELIMQIRKYGKYAFHDDPDHYKKYCSSRQHKKSRKKQDEQERPTAIGQNAA